MLAFPLFKKKALSIPSIKAIAIADVHIGIEYDFSSTGANIPSQTETMLKRCIAICKEEDAERVIILGDVKHTIVPASSFEEDREYRDAIRRENEEVKFFLDELSEIAEILVVKGNHDGGLKSRKNLKVYPSHGISIDNIGFIHGHAWPSEEIMGGDMLVMGHVHPIVRLKDSFGYAVSKPCWVRAHLKEKVLIEKYGNANADMELIIMPSFNPLCGGMAVNTEGIMGPMKKLVDIENANVYLLDGINLGRIGSLKL